MENNNAYTPYSNRLLLFAKDQLLKSTYLQDGFILHVYQWDLETQPVTTTVGLYCTTKRTNCLT